jgi:hypothetical protein
MSENGSTLEDFTEDDLERISGKIARVLEQAEGFRRHGENGSADAALARAEAMMMNYSLDMAVVDATRNKLATEATDEIVKLVLTYRGIYRDPQTRLVNQVCRALGTVRTIYAPKFANSKEDQVWLIGYSKDVKMAEFLLTSLQLQCIIALEAWWKTQLSGGLTAMQKFKERREFMLSFIAGVVTRITTARQALTNAAEPGTAVALRDRGEVINEFMQANFATKMTRPARLANGSAGATSAGVRAGKNVNTGEAGIGVRRRSITTG